MNFAENLALPCPSRVRCYDCYRPAADCFCAAIPRVENRTHVLILQHMRERAHPFNTARIVRRALKNSSLLVDHTENLARRLMLMPGAGLLYPGADSAMLGDLPADQRPQQLVILDGTWHHAKTLLRDIPALQELPRFSLAPDFPSRYRIRREPQAAFLSTVEATVAALRVLEPETEGLDQLLAAFDQMVDRQLGHPIAPQPRRHLGRRKRSVRNVPRALDDLENLVVAYGEASPFDSGRWGPQQPVCWVAERFSTGERFAATIRPEFELSEAFLSHLELTQQDFALALSPEEARAAWSAFLRPGDTVAVYQQGTAGLFHQLGSASAPCIVLKSVDFHPQQRYASLGELLVAVGQAAGPAQFPGRAGRRLAQVMAFVHFLISRGAASGATWQLGPLSSP